MVPYEEIYKLVEKYQEKFVNNFETVLLEDEINALFHLTIRTFGNFPPLKYFSLKLNSVSLESITWIIKSIAQDKMKPTDSLIQSRLKESFAIQIKNKWKLFIEGLINREKIQKNLNKYQKYLGAIKIV